MNFLQHQIKTPFPIIGLHLVVYGVFWAVLTPLDIEWNTPILAALLIWISVSDFKTFEIPDTASLLLLASGLFTAFLSDTLLLGISAAVLWACIFLTISLGYSYLRGFDGLGLGDVKLMGGIGAWLGLLSPVYVVLGAALSAIVALLVVNAIGDNKSFDSTKTGIAFGPFLCLSAWAIWLSGGM